MFVLLERKCPAKWTSQDIPPWFQFEANVYIPFKVHCVGSNGPCVGSNGPCVGSNGPCVGSNGPCVGSNGPCVGSNGPCVGSNGSCVGSNGHCVGSTAPIAPIARTHTHSLAHVCQVSHAVTLLLVSFGLSWPCVFLQTQTALESCRCRFLHSSVHLHPDDQGFGEIRLQPLDNSTESQSELYLRLSQMHLYWVSNSTVNICS